MSLEDPRLVLHGIAHAFVDQAPEIPIGPQRGTLSRSLPTGNVLDDPEHLFRFFHTACN